MNAATAFPEISLYTGRGGVEAPPDKTSPRGRHSPKARTAAARASQRVEALRVLVVEDNLDAAESLARQLHNWGHHCRVCTSGQEALSVLPGYHPQVVLIDIGLPDMDGWSLARFISQASNERPILIAVTAYGEEGDFVRSQRAAISYHLVKPAYQFQLRQILGRIASQQ